MHNVRFISSHVMCTAYLQLTVSYNHYCDRFNSLNCFLFCFLFLCAKTLPLLLLLPFYRTDFALSVLSWINTAWYKLDPKKKPIKSTLCHTSYGSNSVSHWFLHISSNHKCIYIWIAENESKNLNLGINIETDSSKNASILIEQSQCFFWISPISVFQFKISDLDVSL